MAGKKKKDKFPTQSEGVEKQLANFLFGGDDVPKVRQQNQAEAERQREKRERRRLAGGVPKIDLNKARAFKRGFFK